MANEKRDPKAMLEEAIRKRDELNTFIKVYQEMLGLGSTTTPAISIGGGTISAEAHVANGNADEAVSTVYPGMFFGKTQPQAVKAFLETVKPRPQKTRTIIEALAKGGLTIGGKKPAVNLWGVLNRNSDTFILVPKAGWGLVDWYESSVLTKMRKETEKEQPEGEAPAEKDPSS